MKKRDGLVTGVVCVDTCEGKSQCQKCQFRRFATWPERQFYTLCRSQVAIAQIQKAEGAK